jgi:hypothetical protein
LQLFYLNCNFTSKYIKKKIKKHKNRNKNNILNYFCKIEFYLIFFKNNRPYFNVCFRPHNLLGPALVVLILKFSFLNQFSLKIQIKYSLRVYYIFYFIHQRVYYNTNRASHKIKNKMKNRASHM